MQVNGFLTVYNSRADMYGNRYWAVSLYNPDTKQVAAGTIAAENIDTIDCRENLHWVVNRQELKIREFNRLTKGYLHLGCRWEDIKAGLLAQLATT